MYYNHLLINKTNIRYEPNSLRLILNIPPCNVKKPFNSSYVKIKVTEICYPKITFNLYQTKDNGELIDLWKKSAGKLTIELPEHDFIFKKGCIKGDVDCTLNGLFIINMTGERETTYSTWAEGCVFIP